MSGETNIHWTASADGTKGRTWNPVVGCTRSECRQIVSFEQGETFAYVCLVCGHTVSDEIPF
jgi:hypothetical protein